jgi:hypothetical protein
MRNALYVLVTAFSLAFTANSAGEGQKRATPPPKNALVGAWVGFDRGGGEFIRVELRADDSGYCALVSPANFITHDYGVQVYKITKWSIDGWHITLDLSPISSNAEPARASGDLFVSSLLLEIHGVNRRWKIESLLYMESRLDSSNQETKDAILTAQNK